MNKQLVELLKVKSLMTIIVMIVFAYLSLTSKVSSELTSSVITAVITYYFTKEKSKEV